MEDELLYRYYYYLCNCESIITNLILNIIKENTNENDSVYLAGLKNNIKTKEYGYGCILIEGQQVIQQLLGKGNIPEYSSMRNVSGEILGCMKAIAYAIDHHYESICIYYDYEGIEKWATGLWKANKEQTQNYVKTINDMKKKIDIYFQKVLAHSGDYYNEVADGLAKKAVGIKK